MGLVPALTFDITTCGCFVGPALDLGDPFRVFGHQGVAQCLDMRVHVISVLPRP